MLCYIAFSLIYIAGLCYQWLKNDFLSEKDLLRTGELILLKVNYCEIGLLYLITDYCDNAHCQILYYISLRLYYHHLTGCLMVSGHELHVSK